MADTARARAPLHRPQQDLDVSVREQQQQQQQSKKMPQPRWDDFMRQPNILAQPNLPDTTYAARPLPRSRQAESVASDDTFDSASQQSRSLSRSNSRAGSTTSSHSGSRPRSRAGSRPQPRRQQSVSSEHQTPAFSDLVSAKSSYFQPASATPASPQAASATPASSQPASATPASSQPASATPASSLASSATPRTNAPSVAALSIRAVQGTPNNQRRTHTQPNSASSRTPTDHQPPLPTPQAESASSQGTSNTRRRPPPSPTVESASSRGTSDYQRRPVPKKVESNPTQPDSASSRGTADYQRRRPTPQPDSVPAQGKRRPLPFQPASVSSRGPPSIQREPSPPPQIAPLSTRKRASSQARSVSSRDTSDYQRQRAPSRAESVSSRGTSDRQRQQAASQADSPATVLNASEQLPRKTSVASGRSFGAGSLTADDSISPTCVDPPTRLNIPEHGNLPQRGNDIISRHLLLDTALNDCQDYHILSMDEVDQHKGKLKQINGKIFQERRKLAMELKVQNAAQNLHRLYENTASPATLRKKNRHAMSILVDPKKAHEMNATLDASKEEELKTERKIHELQQLINGMTADKSIREGSLFRHSAAVLLAAYNDEVDARRTGIDDGADSEATLINNASLIDDWMPGQSERFTVLQGRLEALNTHIAAAIGRYQQARSQITDQLVTPTKEDNISLEDARDSAGRLAHQIDRLEKSVFVLDHECSPSKLFEDVDAPLRAIAMRAELTLDATKHPVKEPLPLKKADTQTLIRHLNESVLQLEQMLQANDDVIQGHKQALADKCTELDGVSDKFRQIWDAHSLGTAAETDFDLRTFDSAVLHRFQLLTEKNSVLQEQLRQQREVASQPSEEHMRSLGELQDTNAQLQEMHTDLQLRHETTEAQMKAMRQDNEHVMSELERLQLVANSHLEQKQRAIEDAVAQQARVKELESAIREYEQELEDYRANPPITGEEMQSMHDKVVQLTTELAETKAELDRARGSRAERAKEAALTPETRAQLDRLKVVEAEKAYMASELAQLRAEKKSFASEMALIKTKATSAAREDVRKAMLEKELAEMASEHQELTRETIEVEKEREQLEGLVDHLQDRCSSLESQLDDEKVRWLGMKSPNGNLSAMDTGRQSTSTAILKEEFKKMIRATRAEGQKLLKAEQDERKRLEVQLRTLRRDRLAVK